MRFNTRDASYREPYHGYSRPASFILLYLLFSALVFLTFTSRSFADEGIDIKADQLMFYPETSTYSAKGSATILFGDNTLTADNIEVNNKTYNAAAFGNVTYENPEAIIKAEKIEINLKTKLGTIYDGYIYYKTKLYHIRADNIEKYGPNAYFLNKASITTCDDPSPSWKITGSDITAVEDVKLTAWHSMFYVKKLPIFYVPYYWMPLTRKRETGFLFPEFGYSSKRGEYYKQGFFWAMKENQDVSLYLDYYSKKDIGQGFDYRYVIAPDKYGEFWVYHIREKDTTSEHDSPRDLFEIKTYHNMSFENGVSSYLKLHHVNYYDYYDIMESTSRNRIGFRSMRTDPFGYVTDETQLKYLESNFHISKEVPGGRTYLLSQYRQSLEGSSDDIPQILPEIAYILNTDTWNLFSYNIAVKASNFERKEGQKGQRLEINPTLHFSYGRALNITQRLNFREILYSLDAPEYNTDSFYVDSKTTLISRIFKKYASAIHIIEPSIEYTYTPEVSNEEIPVFDSIDSFTKESKITYSLSNDIRGIEPSGLRAKFRLNQDYDLLADERPFSALLTEGSINSRYVYFSLNMSYDVYDDIVTDTISSITLRNNKAFVGVGKNFRKSSELDQMTYKAGLRSPISIGSLSIPLNIQGKLWHNLNTDKTERIDLWSSYKHQCWTLSVNYTELPDDYKIMFVIELEGLGAISSDTFSEEGFYKQIEG